MKTIGETVHTARPALLVVPNFHGRAPLHESPSFLRRLRKWIEEGCEPLLHGFYHLADTPVDPKRHPIRWALSRTLTAGEGEFLNLDRKTIEQRIADGRKQLESLLDVPIKGFVPPAWLRNSGLFSALRTQGFAYTEGHIFLYDLSGRHRLRAPALGFSGRTPARAASSIRFAQALRPRAPSSNRYSDRDSPGGFHCSGAARGNFRAPSKNRANPSVRYLSGDVAAMTLFSKQVRNRVHYYVHGRGRGHGTRTLMGGPSPDRSGIFRAHLRR